MMTEMMIWTIRMSRKENKMASDSRYIEYAKGVKDIRTLRKNLSTKESIITKLKSLKGKKFNLLIPIKEGAADEK